MYDIKKMGLELEDIDRLVSLMKAAFPTASNYSRDYLTWQYLKNPSGKAIGYNAFFENELVAHYVVQPFKLKLEGQIIEAVLSLNTATHPSHQGKGLFTKLANATYEEASRLGKKVVIGVANANSTPGFIRKLGFELYGPLQAKVTFDFGPDLKSEYFMTSAWDEEGLNWRLNPPHTSYFHRNNGGMHTYLADSGKIGIMAVLGTFNFRSRAVIRELPALRNPLNVWIGIESKYESSGSGFPIPQSLRPSPLNFILKKLDSTMSFPGKNEILFQAIDFDAY